MNHKASQILGVTLFLLLAGLGRPALAGELKAGDPVRERPGHPPLGTPAPGV